MPTKYRLLDASAAVRLLLLCFMMVTLLGIGYWADASGTPGQDPNIIQYRIHLVTFLVFLSQIFFLIVVPHDGKSKVQHEEAANHDHE